MEARPYQILAMSALAATAAFDLKDQYEGRRFFPLESSGTEYVNGKFAKKARGPKTTSKVTLSKRKAQKLARRKNR